MVEPVPHRPFDRVQAPSPVRVIAGPAFKRFSLRAGDAAASRAAEGLGFSLPRQACRSAGLGGRHALWLGPDEWLLLCGSDDPLAGELSAALAGLPHALVEVSARQTALSVGGPGAVDLISAACPLDLAPSAFPIGACTRTVFGKAEIVLWRTAEAEFHIEVWRSFAAYVCNLMQAAGGPTALNEHSTAAAQRARGVASVQLVST